MMWLYWFAFLLVAIVFWVLYEWMEHSMVQYNTTVVEFQNLPQEKELKICLITDLHNNRKNLPKLTERISSYSPDLILLAGDLVNKHKMENKEADKFLAAVNNLSVPVYYSAGNHELKLTEEFPESWQRYVKTLPDGICYLDNDSVLFPKNTKICITGLSLSKKFYKKGKLHDKSEELPNIFLPEHEFHILLAHHPEYAPMYNKYNADFIVSGHLHGGLLRLPFIGGIVSPRLRLPAYDSGLKELSGNGKLFISRGLGSHTIPLRFFNRVEVNFITLRKK